LILPPSKSGANALSISLFSKSLSDSLLGLETENIALDFSYGSKQTWRVQPRITWNTNAALALVETQFDEESVNIQQMSKVYGTT
jgi:hypothetical protein